MISKNAKLGILYAIISNIFGGLQPVIANMRPDIFDSYLFAGMTAFIQFIMFLPIFIIETKLLSRNKNKKDEKINNNKKHLKLYFGKSKYTLFIIVGITFSLVMFLYYSGLEIAGSINGVLALKTTAFFGLIFGYLLLKEKINIVQIIFSCLLFFGLIVAVTQGNFSLLQLNFGVILIIICAAIWMVGHTITRPYLQKEIISSSEIIIWRNLMTAIVLLLSYLIIFSPLKMFNLLIDPNNAFYYILGGVIYGINVFCWYQIIKYLDVSIATIIITPQVIFTAIFASILLGEAFTIYHLIGLILILISIIVINLKRSKPKSE